MQGHGKTCRKGIDEFLLQVIEAFQELRRQLLGNQQTGGGGGPKKTGGETAAEPVDAASLMSEMQKNSPYQRRIKDNIEQYGSIIRDLAREVANFNAGDMKILVKFVDSTDAVLDELEDENAVLKQFEWPKKYQTFREAKFMHEKLQAQKTKFKEWPRYPNKTVPVELADIQKYMVGGDFFDFTQIAVDIASLGSQHR